MIIILNDIGHSDSISNGIVIYFNALNNESNVPVLLKLVIIIDNR